MNFPKWLCGLYISPNDIKKEPPLERLTTVCHMIYFLWKNVFVTGSEASTESITGRNENQTKWKICIQKTFLSICIKSSGLYKQVKPH